MTDLYITTSIPYVNGAPHLGHALEFVHVDTLARHRRLRGDHVRVQSGTDDHAIKNVAAAEAAGVPVADLVATNGDRFADLTAALAVGTDGFLRTSSDPRHAPGVGALWRACRSGGDLYTKDYTGLYCTGCEQFFAPDELDGGVCVEHGALAAEVTETNWFFRLSRYREQITALITSGRLDITPAERRNEVLGFLAGDVQDLSVSRPVARTHGWGIPVPDDPGQVVYVWFDALANYLTGLGYACADDTDYRTWWTGEHERVHVIGKGIVRFHAVYWIAFLLSAGLPLPTRILVHDYLTVDGAKIAKSGARAADPATLVADYGADAVRWWLLRAPAPATTTTRLHHRTARRGLQPGSGQHARQPRGTRPDPVATPPSLARCDHRRRRCGPARTDRRPTHRCGSRSGPLRLPQRLRGHRRARPSRQPLHRGRGAVAVGHASRGRRQPGRRALRGRHRHRSDRLPGRRGRTRPVPPRGGGPACRTTCVTRDETRADISPNSDPGSAVTYSAGAVASTDSRAAARIWSDSSPGPMPRATRTAPTRVLSAAAARLRSPSSASRCTRYRST